MHFHPKLHRSLFAVTPTLSPPLAWSLVLQYCKAGACYCSEVFAHKLRAYVQVLYIVQ